jgi:hypothetical protein
MPKLNLRRTLVGIAAAVAVASGTVAGIALAGGNGAGKSPSSTSEAAPAEIVAAAHAALERLVSAGTITQAQADAVQAQVEAGSVDPQTLVANGTVSDAQMRAIDEALGQVKRSFADANGAGKPTSSTPEPAPAEVVAAIHTALERLVSAGTITQAQADAVQAQIEAGKDLQTLVDDGTVNASQLRAIEDALGQVKRSLAPPG